MAKSSRSNYCFSFCVIGLIVSSIFPINGFELSSSSRTKFQQADGGSLPSVQNDLKTPMLSSDSTLTRRYFFNAASLSFLGLAAFSQPALAAKTKDISGSDLSGQDYSNRDFTGVVAKKTNFRKANLQGSVFANADLTGADFSGADVRGANFIDATLDLSSFANAQAQKARFSKSILDVANFENTDLSDSLWPSNLRIMVCDMDEIRGTNPVTGMDTKESLMCTDYAHKS